MVAFRSRCDSGLRRSAGLRSLSTQRLKFTQTPNQRLSQRVTNGKILSVPMAVNEGRNP